MKMIDLLEDRLDGLMAKFSAPLARRYAEDQRVSSAIRQKIDPSVPW